MSFVVSNELLKYLLHGLTQFMMVLLLLFVIVVRSSEFSRVYIYKGKRVFY